MKPPFAAIWKNGIGVGAAGRFLLPSRAAPEAALPGAAIVETDSDGVYEAHLTTSGGERVTVEGGKDFKVTGLESAPRNP